MSEIIEETEPKIDVIPTNISGIRIRGMEIIENNIIITSINNDYKDNNEDYSNYIIIGNKSYNVVTQITLQYAASKFTKNGQTIYYAPYGGVLKNGMVTLEKTLQLNIDDTILILSKYNYITIEEVNEYINKDRLSKRL